MRTLCVAHEPLNQPRAATLCELRERRGAERGLTLYRPLRDVEILSGESAAAIELPATTALGVIPTTCTAAIGRVSGAFGGVTEFGRECGQVGTEQCRSVLFVAVVGRSFPSQLDAQIDSQSFATLGGESLLQLAQQVQEILRAQSIRETRPALNHVPGIMPQHLLPTVRSDARQMHLRRQRAGEHQQAVSHVGTLSNLTGTRQVQIGGQQFDRLHHNHGWSALVNAGILNLHDLRSRITCRADADPLIIAMNHSSAKQNAGDKDLHMAAACWITSADATPWLREFTSIDRPKPADVLRLRKAVGTANADLLLELLEARRQARSKFRRADEMFFTRKSAEQSTDERIAAWKALRFRGQASVVDLGCGAGGDLLGLATVLPAAGIEQSPTLARFAQVNAQTLAVRATVEMRAAESIDLRSFEAWHCDPDRRVDGHRTSQIAFSNPPLETLAKWLQVQPQAAIKLAPAATIPDAWIDAEREWITSRGECRQQVAWFGGLTQRPGWHTATVVDAAGQAATFSADPESDSLVGNDFSSDIGPLLFEPAPSVIAARLCRALARQRSLRFATADGHWLHGDHHPQCGLLQAFELIELLPFDRKRVARALEGYGAGVVEVKTRSLGLDPATLQRELSGDGPEPLTLILMRRAGGRSAPQAAIARRLTKPVS